MSFLFLHPFSCILFLSPLQLTSSTSSKPSTPPILPRITTVTLSHSENTLIGTMLKSIVPLLILAVFAAVCSTRDLIYFKPGACNLNLDHIGCYNTPAYYCCWGSSPWCGRGYCGSCVPSSDLLIGHYDPTHRSCAPIDRYVQCSEPDAKAHCCIDLQSKDFCQLSVFAFRRESIANQTCTKVEPNKMAFTDAGGVQHEIHLPKGTFEAANTHYQRSNWADLKKFPAWGESVYSKSSHMLTQCSHL